MAPYRGALSARAAQRLEKEIAARQTGTGFIKAGDLATLDDKQRPTPDVTPLDSPQGAMKLDDLNCSVSSAAPRTYTLAEVMPTGGDCGSLRPHGIARSRERVSCKTCQGSDH